MPNFFVSKENIKNGYVIIDGEDAHHIGKSLRMAKGEEIFVSDMNGKEYTCVLTDFETSIVKAKIIEEKVSDREMPIKVHLFQGLPKGDKLDNVIQKSVECGVYDINVFESEYCIAKTRDDAEDRKTERRNKISLEASKQSKRGIVPKVYPVISFKKMIEEAKKSDIVLFCYEGEGTESIGKILNKTDKSKIKDVAIVVGSEGGFSEKEFEIAKDSGFFATGLGKRILRTETAPIFAISCVSMIFELS